MKIIIISLSIFAVIFGFAILTGSTGYVYNGTSLNFFRDGFPTFSYADGTKAAESIKN